MSPTPPSTNSSTGHSPAADYRVVRKRNRVPLSCAPCRARKLKCNRGHPCENCTRRGDADGCSYAAPVGPRRRSAQSSNTSTSGGADDMQNRIDRLEGLVLSLMTNGAQAPGLAAASRALERNGTRSTEADEEDVDQMIKEENEDGDEIQDEVQEVESFSKMFGAMKVHKNDEDKSMFVGDNHWHMVLADIAEVRNYFNSHHQDIHDQYDKVAKAVPNANRQAAFLFPQYPPATEAELRGALPPRPQLESLVNRCFSHLHPVMQVLHPPTFRTQVQQYLRSPSPQPIAWIALLYSVLTLAMQSYIEGVEEPPEWAGRTKDMAEIYRQRTVQALVLSDYTRVRAHTLESIILYLHGEYTFRGENDVGLWLIIGMLVRLAMRAGYHRDGAQFKEIEPFAVEMRRRVWLFIRQSDILFSSQLALPSMIKSKDCDTEFPLNIYEESFSPSSASLPSSLPEDTITSVSFIRAKGRLALLLGEIIDETQGLSARMISYTTILAHDAALRSAADAITEGYRVKPLEECANDPPELILTRYYLDTMVAKITCVLHRRYVSLGNQVQRYAPSRIRGVNAGMRLLWLQDTIKHESKEGGRLASVKHRIMTGIQRSDFVLGAMIVCLDLAFLPKKNKALSSGMSATTTSPGSTVPGADELKYTRTEMMEALLGGIRIWEEESSISVEAYKAVGTLRVMIDKISQREEHERQKLNQNINSNFEKTYTAGQQSQQGEEHSAAVTLGMLSAGLTPNTAQMFAGETGMTPGRENVQMEEGYETSAFGEGMSPFSQMFGTQTAGTSGPLDLPDNLDWNAWDRYLQPGDGMAVDTNPYYANFTMGFTPGPMQDGGMQQGQQQSQQQQQQQQDPNGGYGYGYNGYM